MFEVGFSELVMVALVSLIVIGPERLPKVARLAGFWIGKARNIAATFKEEIKQELHTEELRQIFNEQAQLHDLHAALNETNDAYDAIKSSVTPTIEETIEHSKTHDLK
ncbi:MAG: Sec-independent protein translocase protein TatB [Methylococcales bacterium]